jgi:hypothetical protein
MPAAAEIDSIARGLSGDLLQPSDVPVDPGESYLQAERSATPNDVVALRLAAQMPEFATDAPGAYARAQALLLQTCRQIGSVTGYNSNLDHVDSQAIKFGSAQGAADYMASMSSGMVAPVDSADAWNEVSVVALGDETRAFTAVSPAGPLGRSGPIYLTTLVFRHGDSLGIVQLVGDNIERTSLDRAQQLAQLIADRMAAATSVAPVAWL